MVRVFLDCETTGLPKNWGAPLDQWPRMVEFAAIKVEGTTVIDKLHFIVKPQGFYIPDESTRLHGISHAKAMREGIEIGEGLKMIKVFLDGSPEQVWPAVRAEKIIIHNAQFDTKIIVGEMIRLNPNERSLLRDPRLFCSKEKSTQILKLPYENGRKGFKWPSLHDLCKYCDVVNEDAHSAMADVMATYECWKKMREKGHWLL